MRSNAESTPPVKGARQKRFIRFRTLGVGYSEEELKAVLAGEAEHRPRQKCPAPEQKFQMLVDIQAKLAEGKGTGFARWAKAAQLKRNIPDAGFLAGKQNRQHRGNAGACGCCNCTLS